MSIRMCKGHPNGDYDSYKSCGNSEESFIGAVLDKGERNMHDDSDFYAVVWDDERQCVTTKEYASTRGWTYHNSCTVDATPETLVKARAWAAEKYMERARAKHATEQAEPKIGRKAKSLTTRGKAKGVSGEIAWIGSNNYANHWSVGNAKLSIGIRPDGMPKGQKNLVFVPGDKVEITPDDEPFDESYYKDVCESWVNGDPWMTIASPYFWID